MWTLLVLTLVMASLATAFLIAFYSGPRVWFVHIPVPGAARRLRISGYGIALTIVASAFLLGAFSLERIRTHDSDHHGKTVKRNET